MFLSASVSPLDGAQQNQVCHLQTPWPGTPCPGLLGKLRHRDTLWLCFPWGLTQHQRDKGPRERGIFPHTGPAWLLLVLAAQTQGQELLLPGDRHQAFSLWDCRGQAGGSLWLLPCSPGRTGPWQPGQGQAWTRRALAGPQNLCPRTGGDSSTPACRVLLPTGLCQGNPLHLRGSTPVGGGHRARAAPQPGHPPCSAPLGLGSLLGLRATGWEPKAAAQPRAQG